MGWAKGHMEREVKINMRHPSVTGTMSQFMHVEIITINFLCKCFLYSCLLLSSLHIPKFVLETFSFGLQLTKIGGTFLTVEENFTINKGYCAEYIVDTDSYCIPSEISANKTLAS